MFEHTFNCKNDFSILNFHTTTIPTFKGHLCITFFIFFVCLTNGREKQ